MGRGHTDTQTDTQTYGHRDSMIESAQWADSMKIAWEGDKQTNKQTDIATIRPNRASGPIR